MRLEKHECYILMSRPVEPALRQATPSLPFVPALPW